MLNSVVRVSRRVRGVADLLVTEMPAATTRDARYTSWLKYPPSVGDRIPGLATTRATNFTQVHVPQTVVRHVEPHRSAVVDRADRSAESSRIKHTTDAPAVNLNL